MSKAIKTNRAIVAFVRNLRTSAKKQDAKTVLRNAKKILKTAEATSAKDWTPDMVESVNKASKVVRRVTKAVKSTSTKEQTVNKKPTAKPVTAKKPAKKNDDVIVVSDKTTLTVTIGDTVAVRVRAHNKVAGIVGDRIHEAVRRDLNAMLKEFGGAVASGKGHATSFFTVKLDRHNIKRLAVSPRALDYVIGRIKEAVKAELSEIKAEFRAAKVATEKSAAVAAPVARKRNAPARPARQLKSKPFGKSTKKTAK